MSITYQTLLLIKRINLLKNIYQYFNVNYKNYIGVDLFI